MEYSYHMCSHLQNYYIFSHLFSYVNLMHIKCKIEMYWGDQIMASFIYFLYNQNSNGCWCHLVSSRTSLKKLFLMTVNYIQINSFVKFQLIVEHTPSYVNSLSI
jgi:hypothetical protein